MYGAAGEVTGSCYVVENGRARVMIDFGMIQGERDEDVRNQKMPPVDVSSLSAVVLTHAHIDHTGRLPLLVKHGYKGPIYATPATCKLTPILLEDSANLQENDARRESVRNARRGRPAVEPLYRVEDAKPVEGMLVAMDYQKAKEVAPGIRVRFTEAGHILGSASVECVLTDAQGGGKRVVFSGDIGPRGVPLMRDFEPPVGDATPDLVICESTYGDRDHRSLDDTVEELAGILREAIWEKEKVLMPTFAIGRSQTLLYYLDELSRSGRVPRFPIYLDSPMAVKATKLYDEFWRTLDEEAKKRFAKNGCSLCLDTLICTASPEESRRLNEQAGAMVILAGSGMCNGGRIVHHLRHNLYKRDVRVVICGYQAHGTLGRRLVDGAEEVKIFGEPIIVRAKVSTLGGFSAHAGQSDLTSWVGAFAPKTGKAWPRIFLTHGEDSARVALREHLGKRLGVQGVVLPTWGASVEL
jgi:metallo-beta-lactamase family protein